MITIQAMLAIPASFISWSEWQFPPWECLWLWECPWRFAFCSFFWVETSSGSLFAGGSAVWISVSCVSLWLLSQGVVQVSGSGGGPRRSWWYREGREELFLLCLPSPRGLRCSHSASERRFNLWSDNFLPILPSSFTFFMTWVRTCQSLATEIHSLSVPTNHAEATLEVLPCGLCSV